MLQEQSALGGFFQGAFDFLDRAGEALGTAIETAGRVGEATRGAIENVAGSLGAPGTGGSGETIPQTVEVASGRSLVFFGILAAAVYFLAKR